MLRSCLVVVALAGACKKSAEPAPDPRILDADVLVRIDDAGHSAAELEPLVATHLEQALTAVVGVAAIDTKIHDGQVELALTVAPNTDARAVSAAVEKALASAALPASAAAPITRIVRRANAVLRFGADELPTPIDTPRVTRVRMCGLSPLRTITIDVPRLRATKLAIDDVLAAVDPAAQNLAAIALPGGIRLGDIANVGDSRDGPCEVLDGNGRAFLGSVHYGGDDPSVFEVAMRAGWKPLDMLGGQVELVLDIDDASDEEASVAIARVAGRLRATPGITGGVVMEELGPPHIGRIIFRPKFDVKVAAVVRAAAAVPGVRIREHLDGDSQHVEALITGERTAAIARARAVVQELAALDPEGYIGCTGCDTISSPALRIGEAVGAMTPRLVTLLGTGLVLPGAPPVRVEVDASAEISPELLGEIPVRVSDRVVPLSSVSSIEVASRPSVLLRYNGQPAVIVWVKPWSIHAADAEEALTKALPGATVRTRYVDLW